MDQRLSDLGRDLASALGSNWAANTAFKTHDPGDQFAPDQALLKVCAVGGRGPPGAADPDAGAELGACRRQPLLVASDGDPVVRCGDRGPVLRFAGGARQLGAVAAQVVVPGRARRAAGGPGRSWRGRHGLAHAQVNGGELTLAGQNVWLNARSGAGASGFSLGSSTVKANLVLATLYSTGLTLSGASTVAGQATLAVGGAITSLPDSALAVGGSLALSADAAAIGALHVTGNADLQVTTALSISSLGQFDANLSGHAASMRFGTLKVSGTMQLTGRGQAGSRQPKPRTGRQCRRA